MSVDARTEEAGRSLARRQREETQERRLAHPLAAAHRSRQIVADLALLAVTVVWGGTFVMVKDATAVYPVFGFLALRFAFAALAMLPLLWWLRRRSGARARLSKRTPIVSAACLIGLALFAGYGFQTSGLHVTTPAKAGFITGLGIVIVPLIAALLLRQAPGLGAWLGVGLATVGLGLLSWQRGERLNPGDILVFFCALSFAIHILLTGRYASQVDPLWLTLGQIVTVAVLSGAASLIWETRPVLTLPVVGAAIFTGLLATSAAFGIQTVAQRFTTATHTALIFVAEPVFAGLFSFILIGEALGPRQLAGCGLILAGMLAAELIRRPLSTAKPGVTPGE